MGLDYNPELLMTRNAARIQTRGLKSLLFRRSLVWAPCVTATDLKGRVGLARPLQRGSSVGSEGCGNLHGDEEIAREKIRVKVAERRRDTQMFG